jgi:hypothetical protein
VVVFSSVVVVSGVVVVSVVGVSVVCLAHAARANTMVSARSKAMIFFISEKSSIHKFYHPARFARTSSTHLL